MKNNNKLVTILYIASRFAYRFAQLFIFSAIFFEFFTPNGEIGSYSSSIHHSKGYPIEARIQLSIPDTLIIYENKAQKRSGNISKSKVKEWLQDFNKINKDKQLDKTYQINTFKLYRNGFNEVNKEFNNVEIQTAGSEISVVINPTNIFLKSILIFKNYLGLILFLFITYQCTRLFKQLKNQFVFDKQLNTRIRNIGFSLLIFQIVEIVVSNITRHYLTNIHYQHYIPSIENSDFRFMNLTPIIEYDLNTIFLGLCLVVLAKLLNYGFDLQNENELTI